jgi:hypothetical protein
VQFQTPQQFKQRGFRKVAFLFEGKMMVHRSGLVSNIAVKIKSLKKG